MADFEQIIIGAGTSAYTYLYYAYVGSGGPTGVFKPGRGKVLLVGKSDLWKDVVAADPEHKIGQPSHFLKLPGSPESKTPSQEFMSSADYVNRKDDLERRAAIGVRLTTHYGLVTSVARNGEEYDVVVSPPLDNRSTFSAKMVIVATAGPQSKMPGLANEPDDTGQPYRRVIDAVSYMNGTQPPVPNLCVYGASATSSWAVKRAVVSEVQNVMWLGRSGFSEANPAGRNNDVITKGLEKNWLCIGSIKSVKVEKPFPAGNDPRAHEPTVEIDFAAYGEAEIRKQREELLQRLQKGAPLYEVYRRAEKQRLESGGMIQVLMPDGSTQTVPVQNGGKLLVHQFVVALGASKISTAILSADLQGKLKPVFDIDKRFGDKSEDTVVAMHDGHKLWVVGAAVFREAPNYANVTQMLPKNGHPPEGIAGITASMKALTGFQEFTPSQINFTTADFKEIESWCGFMYRRMVRENRTQLPLQIGWSSLPMEVERFVADQIVALRRHTVKGSEQLGGGGQDAMIDTVETMLASRGALEAWAPPEVLSKWAAR